MELNDQKRIEAPRDRVYAALNEPEVLKQCIPGCEDLEKTDDNAFQATVVLKIGPLKAKFKGNVRLENLNPPASYSIVGEGAGGVAGFAKGSADVELDEDGDATILKYKVHADVGGKLAQLGSRLVLGTSKKLADEFFTKFAAVVSGAA